MRAASPCGGCCSLRGCLRSTEKTALCASCLIPAEFGGLCESWLLPAEGAVLCVRCLLPAEFAGLCESWLLPAEGAGLCESWLLPAEGAGLCESWLLPTKFAVSVRAGLSLLSLLLSMGMSALYERLPARHVFTVSRPARPPQIPHVTFFIRLAFSRTNSLIIPNAPNTMMINTVDNTLANPNLRFSEKL